MVRNSHHAVSVVVILFVFEVKSSNPTPFELTLKLSYHRSKKQDGRSKDSGSSQIAAEILIIQKSGYYLEEMKAAMPHVDYRLKVKYPQHPCSSLMKQKNYPLVFLSDNQEAVDSLF